LLDPGLGELCGLLEYPELGIAPGLEEAERETTAKTSTARAEAAVRRDKLKTNDDIIDDTIKRQAGDPKREEKVNLKKMNVGSRP
jgi:hypothetical protein